MDREAQLLVVVHLPGGAMEAARFVEVDRPVQIGSAAACQVRISVNGVLPVHAEVILSGWSLHVMDRSHGKLYDLTRPISSVELPYRQQISVALRGTGVRVDLTSGIRDRNHLSTQDRVRVVKNARPVRPIEDLLPLERGPGGRVDATLLTPRSRDEFTFNDGIATTIGRTRACRIRVPDEVEGVSRTHARLIWENGWLVLEDLGSTNGTWINNHRIKRVVVRSPAHHHVELGQSGALLSVRVVTGRARPAKPVLRLAPAATDAMDVARQLDEQRQLLDTLERRRIAAEADWECQWSQIHAERHALQEERRQLAEERQRRPLEDSENTDPTLTALVNDELQWLMGLPEPDREVFRHLATHGLVNEEDATRILGSPRRFRQFSLRFEAHRVHCPFRVRIETAGAVKCYVREADDDAALSPDLDAKDRMP